MDCSSFKTSFIKSKMSTRHVKIAPKVDVLCVNYSEIVKRSECQGVWILVTRWLKAVRVLNLKITRCRQLVKSEINNAKLKYNIKYILISNNKVKSTCNLIKHVTSTNKKQELDLRTIQNCSFASDKLALNIINIYFIKICGTDALREVTELITLSIVRVLVSFTQLMRHQF